MQGWISIHRQIKDNFIWKQKPFSKGQAWIDILLRVNHQPKKVPIGNQIIEVEEGQTIWSILDMADSWGWSRKKVDNFLKLLEKEQMLYNKRTTKYTTLTVINWGLYQNEEQQKEQQKSINGTSKEQQKNTNNNDNNDNNDNNTIKDHRCNKSSNPEPVIKFDIESFEIQLAIYLIGKIKNELPNARTPDINNITDLQRWAIHVDRMRRLDNRNDEDIKRVLRYATTDPFWKTNILSTKSLRDKFDTLYAQCNRKPNNGKQQDNMDMMNEWLKNSQGGTDG